MSDDHYIVRNNPQESFEATMSVSEKYYDLLLSVGIKHPGETRHATAKRYIMAAERSSENAECCTEE